MLSFNQSDDEFISELSEYVGFASVSRDGDPDVMMSTANWLASQLEFADPKIIATNGHPVVFAYRETDPALPTILVYGHYDVQPTGDLGEWESPPFVLTRKGDVLLGRGITDDKGPVYIVLKVAQAFISQLGSLPLNVKFIFEGEEEIGSPNFADFVISNKEMLACDLVISADGAMWRASEPSLSLASKGLVTFDIVVTGAAGDLHSGRYGGTVANSIHGLSEILSSLHLHTGEVGVDGFYDGIPPISIERREEIADVKFSDDEFLGPLGVEVGYGEAGYTTLERLWERPTLEINGISAGGKYTVIPHVAKAHLSCRLVPGQDPEAVVKAVTKHIEDISLPGLDVEVFFDPPRIPAYTIPSSHPAIQAAKSALEQVYEGQSVLFATIAGTLPAAALFEDELGAKTLFFSFSTSDERLHAPNEFLRISRLREGMLAWELLWKNLGSGPHVLLKSKESGS